MYFDPDTEREPCCTCDVCGETVYVGDEIYIIGDLTICAGCVEYGRGIAANRPL